MVKCDLHIITDEDGVEQVLPTEKEIRQYEERVENAIQALQDELSLQPAPKGVKATDYEKRISLEFHARSRSLRAGPERMRKLREAWMPKAELRQYRIKLPTLGEWMEAEDEARTLDTESGDVNTDLRVMMKKLLPKSVAIEEKSGIRDLSDQEVNDLSPVVGERLWQKLFSAANPNPERINFLSLPSGI